MQMYCWSIRHYSNMISQLYQWCQLCSSQICKPSLGPIETQSVSELRSNLNCTEGKGLIQDRLSGSWTAKSLAFSANVVAFAIRSDYFSSRTEKSNDFYLYWQTGRQIVIRTLSIAKQKYGFSNMVHHLKICYRLG